MFKNFQLNKNFFKIIFQISKLKLLKMKLIN